MWLASRATIQTKSRVNIFIMNQKEWQKLFDDNYIQLKTLVEKFHPNRELNSQNYSEDKYPITAPAAEEMCEIWRKYVKTQNFMELLKNGTAEQRLTVLNEAWLGMPESMVIRSEPGFFELCELCERWEE